MEQTIERDPAEQRKDEYREKYKTDRDIPALAKQMQLVQRQKEGMEAALKDLNAEFDVLRLEIIPQRCEEQGIEGMRVEGVGRLSLTPDLYVSTKAGAKVGLFAWLRKNKLRDLIAEGVASSTLKAFVKGRMKAGKEIPTEFLNVTPFTRASITKG